MKTITIHLDIRLILQLQEIAKQQNITLNEVITNAIKLKLKELENDGSL